MSAAECTCTIELLYDHATKDLIMGAVINPCALCKAAPTMLLHLKTIVLDYFDSHGYGRPEEQEEAREFLRDIQTIIEEASK